VPLLAYKLELHTIFFSLKDSDAVVSVLKDNEDNEEVNDEDNLVENSVEDPV
jgi:hypothetical protein